MKNSNKPQWNRKCIHIFIVDLNKQTQVYLKRKSLKHQNMAVHPGRAPCCTIGLSPYTTIRTLPTVV